ncbi:DNA-directed RNA polymerase subunit K [Candidatus Woesearchaeota archaeon CG10_big_fil_rev_8_21_14_0_10_34_8]|nr:MAG: DNA-directed RNA polymerase subunit K [Candidatus Woesearchaeota archaeon CG10_big_fil_rev_8_21_14_0_10_34_8]
MKYTRFEKARIIGARALQISQGAPFLMDLKEKDLEKIGFNSIEIAKMEFEKDLIPMTVKRPLPMKAKLSKT